jgi:hypothetical protein
MAPANHPFILKTGPDRVDVAVLTVSHKFQSIDLKIIRVHLGFDIAGQPAEDIFKDSCLISRRIHDLA